MPTYEYLCQSCSHRFETWQKMTDEPLTTCPECGSRIRRVLFPAGVVFKGQGFYKTDYSNKNNGNGTNGAEANGTDKKAEKGESGGEAKTSTEGSKPTESSASSTSNGSSSNGSSSSGESKASTTAGAK